MTLKTSKPTVIDLFCGVGGLHQGFKNAGYDVLLSSDFDEHCMRTHQHNFPDIPFIHEDIKNLTAKQIWKVIGEKRKINLIVGGPPCQGFSTIGNRASSQKEKRAKKDPRNFLFKEYFRLIGEIRPDWVLMENVKGLLTMKNGKRLFIDNIITHLKQIGYKNAEYQLLDTADYGVPQHRKRVIIIANRVGKKIIFPRPTHGPNGRQPYATVGEAILPLMNFTGAIPNHDAMNHGWKNLERYKLIPEGGRMPEHLLSKEIFRRNFGNTFKRLDRNKPALTMVPGHSGFPIHPVLNRSLTVREAARLQTFPDTTEFFGSRTKQGMQVGNAVPVKFAEAIANHLLGEITQ